MLKNVKKYLSVFLVVSSLLQPVFCLAQDKTESDLLDESLRDFSVVIGAGIAGAVLGLSTLSFVEEPSAHLKNIAVGGALGVVVGVGYVVFSQATRSTSVMAVSAQAPISPAGFETVTRKEFSEIKIAQDHLLQPSVGFSLRF